jgi:DNA-binding Lrp family transcriptional regulator
MVNQIGMTMEAKERVLHGVGDDTIVTALQRGVPLAPRPFAVLGRALGKTEDSVLGVLRRMLEDGSARRFGAVFDARRLGYRSELCAMDVPEADLGRIGSVVAAHPGVTHCYRRGHPPGIPRFPERADAPSTPELWFTLAVLKDQFLAQMEILETLVSPYGIWRLPAARRFKIDVVFDPSRRDAGERVPGMTAGHAAPDHAPEPMTGTDRQIVQAMEGSMPVRPDLFAGIAAASGWSVAALLDRLRAWECSGTLRRIAMVVGQQRIGYTANAMCIWPVESAAILEAGRRLAAWPDVTHCYERPVRPGWPYNLYAMISASDWGEAQRLFERISASAGLAGGRLLGSLHAFKRTSMQYFAD